MADRSNVVFIRIKNTRHAAAATVLTTQARRSIVRSACGPRGAIERITEASALVDERDVEVGRYLIRLA